MIRTIRIPNNSWRNASKKIIPKIKNINYFMYYFNIRILRTHFRSDSGLSSRDIDKENPFCYHETVGEAIIITLNK